jgi:hypothetical protein
VRVHRISAGSIHRIGHFFVVGQGIFRAVESGIPAEQISGFRQEMLWVTHRKNRFGEACPAELSGDGGFFASFFYVKTPLKLTICFYPESSVQ